MTGNKTLNEFLTLFAITSVTTIKETLKELQVIFKTSEIVNPPSKEEILSYITFLNPRDSLKITVLIGEDEPIDYYSSQDYQVFFTNLKNRLEIREDEEIEFQFTISKNKHDNVISVYFPEQLISYLQDLDLKGVLYTINNVFGSHGYLLLESQFVPINFRTNSIWLTSDISTFSPAKLVDQSTRIEACKGMTNFNLVNQYPFIPDDFYVEVSSDSNVKDLFNRLCTVYSIAYLYDITSIENSEIEYKLNGYKSIKGKVDFKKISAVQASEYYQVYDWCYNGGNLSDKIGLARNILSLHLESVDRVDLKGNAYQSIQSSYKVYERQNIKQYIEIRNKISDQLLGFHDRASNIIENFATGFQKSALALISFYISAIILKLLGKTEMVNVFTLDATILSLVFITCSYIYYRISIWEVNEQKKRFISSYANMKDRHLDLLDSIDIQRIVNNDKDFNEDLTFIDQKQKMYGRMWKGYLLILSITTIILFAVYNINQLLDTKLARFLLSPGSCV